MGLTKDSITWTDEWRTITLFIMQLSSFIEWNVIFFVGHLFSAAQITLNRFIVSTVTPLLETHTYMHLNNFYPEFQFDQVLIFPMVKSEKSHRKCMTFKITARIGSQKKTQSKD